VLTVLERHKKVFLRLNPIDTAASHLSSLWNANPDMLSIKLPIYTNEGIRYGLFGTGTTDKTSLTMWHTVARAFFRSTFCGLWGWFPSTKRKKY
jgi:hypothetical protein